MSDLPIEADTPAAETPPSAFPIVGIGASAGGVAAFEAFFSTMPPDSDTGIAFVLVQHLSRDHKSILSDLVRRYTKMQVFVVEDQMEVEPNCAYIIPPNRDMSLVNGKLQLLEPTLARGIRLPIDHFFRSLAQDQHERAICIVLSGTGSDGALGLRAVKGEGGMVMAQAPDTTEFDGMPRSAIATGMVDFVLPPKEMPAQLLAYVSHAFRGSDAQSSAPPAKLSGALEKVFMLLRLQVGHDFSKYKRSTIIRRVERRMAVHQIERLDDYLRYLQLTPAEVEALFHDLLIGVTNFFRDAEIFEEIRAQAIPKLLDGKAAGAVVRVWVPGCSTGEEAYSLAILLREQMDERKTNYRVQIFATDIDRDAIETARAGVYPASIIADVSAERLAHFFDQEQADGSTYRIHKSIRDMLIFSEHDLIKDPPFSKLDLISCRNLLIYMGPELQRALMPLFHYALNPDGILMLGSSESIGDFGNLFAPVDRKSKIYRRKPNEAGARHAGIARLMSHPAGTAIARQAATAEIDTKLPLHQIAERALLEHYAPVGALVTERGDILYLVGRTGKYLEPTPGEASMNIFRMAREGLRGDLTIALHRAVSSGAVTRQLGLTVKGEGVAETVNLTVRPVAADLEGAIPRGLYLVLLDNQPDPAPRVFVEAAADGGKPPAPDLDTYILRLKQELRSKDEFLQTTIEELETSNEELRSAHEEMQSVNEEMQSTNEELETSKEELQSVNEELATLNNELQSKVADLSRSNSDMKNLLSGTGIGTIFVDHALRILRFTPTVAPLISLIDSDMGRPVDQIRSNLENYDSLAADIREVLKSLIPKDQEVRTKTGEWYLLRIRPYRTLDNVVEGAVITFTEITAMKKAEQALRDAESLRHLAAVIRDSSDAILVYDLAGRILAWNPAAKTNYGWTEAEAIGLQVGDLLPKGEGEKGLEETRRLCKVGSLTPQRVQRLAKGGGLVSVSIIVSPLVNNSGEMYAIASTERLADDG